MVALRLISKNVLNVPTLRRTFMKTSIARADIVTDMYLKSLKDFKPTPTKASDAEGQVKAWSAPKAPAAPSVASDVSGELSAYESAETDAAGATTSGSSESDGDWFELDTAPDRNSS